MNEKDAVLTLWNKTSGLIDEKLSHAYYDKTFPSVIYGKNGDGTYKIVREGILYDVPNSLGIELKKGQSIWVTMPCGTKKLKDMYISGVRDGYEIAPSGGEIKISRITNEEIDSLFK